MKKQSFFGALLTLMTFVFMGCTDNQESEGIPLGNDVTIIASHSPICPPVNSRTVVGDIQADGALIMNWEVDDAIGVFTTDGNNLKFVNQNTSPSPNASFVPAVGVNVTSDPQVGYYPYNSNVSNRNSIPVVIPNIQNYADPSSIAQYDVKAATVTKQSDGNFLLQMQQMASLIRFEINATELKNEIEKWVGAQTDLTQVDMNAQHIQSVEISTNDHVRLTGSYTYDLMNLEAGFVSVGTDNTDGSLTVNLTNQPLLSSTENLVFYAVVVPGQHSGNTLTCKVLCERVSLQFSAKIGCNFAAGSYYTLALNSATIAKAIPNTIKVAVTPDPDAPAKPVYPGQDEETANCYMINTTGAHEFWGTQIGNGAKGIIKGAGFHTENPYINPKSAKLVWQDVQNFVSGIIFKPEDGKVHYTANKTSGNALIAVYDGPDGTGNVLWSWHIWGVGDEIPGDVELTNMSGATFTMLDRTLGAHSATSCLATLYQWGRKDPIPNSGVYYTEEGEQATAIDIDKQYPVFANLSSPKIVDGIANPDKILTYKAGDSYQGTWCTDSNTLLWGDEKNAGQPWYQKGGYCNKEAGAGWKYQKTIYDPSPVGYRVANMFTYTGFIKNKPWDRSGDASTTGQHSQSDLRDIINCVSTVTDNPSFPEIKFNNGYYFKKNENDTEGIFFPMIGYRSNSTGTRWSAGNGSKNTVTVSADYWSSCSWKSSYSDEYLVSGLYISEFIGWENNRQYDGKNQLKTVNLDERQCFINGVRCVRE